MRDKVSLTFAKKICFLVIMAKMELLVGFNWLFDLSLQLESSPQDSARFSAFPHFMS